MRKLKPGESFEVAVEELHRVFGEDVVIRRNETIDDIVGQPREFDVTIRFKLNGMEHLGVIECKDHSRKVGLALVEEIVVQHGGFYRRWLSMIDDLAELQSTVARLEGTTEDLWVPVWRKAGLEHEEEGDRLELLGDYRDARREFLQAKTYYGGGTWYELDLDYARIARIMREAGFRGYVSLEFEGKADPDRAIPESLALLRKHFS